MSKPIDLKAMFGDPNAPVVMTDEIRGDDYVNCFKIFDLPEMFSPGDFAPFFVQRATDYNPNFPSTIFLQGTATLVDTAGHRSKTSLIHIVFKEPVDIDIVSEMLIESIEEGLAAKSLEEPEDGYAMEPAYDVSFEESLAELQRINGNDPSAPHIGTP